MRIENPMHRLKPGMFINAGVELGRVEAATIVPEQAVTLRGDRTGVFLVDKDGTSVVWREVQEGVRQDGRVQVTGEGLSGRVVTLGQQMISDGARISIPAEQTIPAGSPPADSRKSDS
jgi:multidrug efflux pump subunit AcrA (membrane-fusion protein)